ncbi:hypothetical protein ONE63_011345 [Megalurothrips usitatus]|uniref:ATP-dependent DNA helicase n=1 Tax=Megalurothrips usitatus TaxID=439358 RepID=A0AAV7X508_9NEOP|nr:hypothetical protein ONE63_011345 [Megalurothrips usitatus]
MEPFQYPLLYPQVTLGRQVGRLDYTGNKLSLHNYARCLLLSEPRFSELGRLSQAWEVEMFARYEEKLLYISNCQEGGGMRVGPQDEVADAVRNPPQQVRRDVAQDLARDETVQGEGGPVAGKVFLPSFTGSPRYMKIKYMDAMGLVSRKGGPTSFLTFTASGAWDELKQSTRSGNKCDPATVSRIFHTKLKELLRDIRSGALFGPTAYILYVIEMQIRGLPHAHIAIRVGDGGPVQGKDVDGVVRADIPGPEEAGGRPRELNAALLLRYDAHIDLEISSTRRVIKYLFKYMTKGGSHQNMRVVPLHEQQDEPDEYARRRMIGASDACWRLLDFHLTVSEPSVTMLPVHLEGQHSVVFKPGREEDAIESSSSLLLLYFNGPQNRVFDALAYQDFHEQYVIHTKRPRDTTPVPVFDHPDGKQFLTPRQRGERVTRMFWVSPNLGGQYFLRVLLANVPCCGYADLLSKGGEQCTTFQEVARVLGFVNNEEEYTDALRKAATFMTRPRLREFFVVLVNVGAPAAILWDQFRDLLCKDHLERHPLDPEKAYKLSLIHIDRSLRRSGSCNKTQGLPDVRDDTTELGRQYLQYSVGVQAQFVQEWEPQLTNEQRCLLDHIKVLLDEPSTAPARRARTLFLDGPGGYGRTQVLKVIVSHVRSQGKVALCVASSGIAALNMEGGTTAHNMYRLPLDLGNGVGTWNIRAGTQRAQLIKAASLIVFDEAPTAHRHLFEMVDR